MATESFDRRFVVSDSKSIEQLRKDLDEPQKVKTGEKRDYEKDKDEGIALLKQKLLNLGIY